MTTMTTSIKLALVLLVSVLTTACSDTPNNTVSVWNERDDTLGMVGIESELHINCDVPTVPTLSVTFAGGVQSVSDGLVYYTDFSSRNTQIYVADVDTTASQQIVDTLLPRYLSGESAVVYADIHGVSTLFVYPMTDLAEQMLAKGCVL